MIFNINNQFQHDSGIYSIKNRIDDRFYIGSTINFWKRYKDHFGKLTIGNHANRYLQAFAKKYGIDTLIFEMVLLCKATCLKCNEKLCIEQLKPQFNIKAIIERPYFEDERIFNLENLMKKAIDADEIIQSKISPDLLRSYNEKLLPKNVN
jgi:group I intron endonuclease